MLRVWTGNIETVRLPPGTTSHPLRHKPPSRPTALQISHQSARSLGSYGSSETVGNATSSSWEARGQQPCSMARRGGAGGHDTVGRLGLVPIRAVAREENFWTS